jgi:branched-chain amino acid transport system substrate-binding protein
MQPIFSITLCKQLSQLFKKTFWRLLLGCVLLLGFSGCATPRPTLKIALVAPFEGRYRDTGYAVFNGFRDTLTQQNLAGGINGYFIEFVAYNDSGDPTYAQRISQNITHDPQVVLVIGHLRQDTTNATAATYESAEIPVLAMGLSPSDIQPAQTYIHPIKGTIEEVTSIGLRAIAIATTHSANSHTIPSKSLISQALASMRTWE